ncbi:MAG TPA: glycosyltransferase, partial [Candidatus Baltobacteraceae bacterium]|nr:glycosyltransferase [Candidatus Baltobacteraceae bacterium]
MWLARNAHNTISHRRRRRALRRAWRLPKKPSPVCIPTSATAPVVSVVVPAFNRWQYTSAALRALAAACDPAIAMEIIVVDDASTDETPELLAACEGVRTIRLERNGGFGAACNAGAAAARGTYLHFLNNDAFVTPGWLAPLVETFERDASIAAVVSQLRYADGTLAEAGGVMWRDGRGSNYGRGDSPDDWRYASARDVDYGSAASLMVRANAFAGAGGFAPEFAPAYYEDADLCFALRERGGRVVYQPRSVVYHAEGVSYGSNVRSDARALQERNRHTFAAKWAQRLSAHFEPDPSAIDRAARRLGGSQTMLVVDDHVPFTDRDAGSRRIFALIELMRRGGRNVIFGSVDRTAYEPYAAALRDAGVDVIAGFGEAPFAQLERDGIAVDAAWLCRPEPAARLLDALDGTPAVFDTVDVHYVRLQREERLLGYKTGWQTERERELGIARRAALTVTTTTADRNALIEAGIANVSVLPVVEAIPPPSTVGWGARDGIVFLGNYAHAPNVDAVQWLCREILPLLRHAIPGVTTTLAGTDPTRAVRALARRDVAVSGYVADPGAVLERARVFVAPLRFGAGMKGKVVYALAHGIPVVATPVAAEGIFEP